MRPKRWRNSLNLVGFSSTIRLPMETFEVCCYAIITASFCCHTNCVHTDSTISLYFFIMLLLLAFALNCCDVLLRSPFRFPINLSSPGEVLWAKGSALFSPGTALLIAKGSYISHDDEPLLILLPLFFPPACCSFSFSSSAAAGASI